MKMDGKKSVRVVLDEPISEWTIWAAAISFFSCLGLTSPLSHIRNNYFPTGDVFDLTVFTNADIDKCIERLKVRNACLEDLVY